MDIQSLYEIFLKCGKVSTDTREITPGSIFFALKGPNFNANTFAEEALRKGARYAVIDEKEFAKWDSTILVEDGLKALQQLARHHRNQLNLPVIGLTGSNGKTTTKELLFTVLSKKYKTHATQGNLNNHIGVPLTILAMDSSVEVAVIEMGANHLGEIALLSGIASPTHGLITNIGKAHIGPFGSFENILRAKSELYQHLINHHGNVFMNSQNPFLANMSKRFPSPIFYPAKGDYYHSELLSADPFIEFQADNGERVSTHLMGSYNFENIAAALCIAKYFDVDPGVANRAVGEYEPANMRSQIIRKETNTIILDAYNANPSSMEAAIESLAKMKSQRKVAVLGDMYELGKESDVEHRRLGTILLESGIKEVYLCGSLIRVALETFPTAEYYSTREELVLGLKASPIRNAAILIKASRGMGLETIVNAI
jgi:UDP-N-acetylmuramoyl-tripeptide--D-alanyl-D-alanine ligase